MTTLHNEIKKNYIRVTDVLFPFSGLGQIDPVILQRAAERGTLVHAYIDAIVQEIGYNITDLRVTNYVESFKKWMPRYFIDKPDRFYCDELGITGECDGLYEEDGALVLVDYKTSAKEGKTWPLQGSAYAYLARKDGYNIKRIEFVKLCKEGRVPKVFVYEENFDLFLKCLEIYKHFFRATTTEIDIEDL